MGQERGAAPLRPSDTVSDHGLPQEIEADGFRLRRLGERDAGDLFAAVDRARAPLDLWTSWSRQVHDVATMRRFLKGWLARPQYAIEVGGAIRGMLGVYGRAAEEPWLDLGYWLEPAVCGRGIMTRATRALAVAANREILLAIHPRNAPSLGIAERLGLTPTSDVRMWGDERLSVFRGWPDAFANLISPAPFLRRHEANDAVELYAAVERARASLALWMPWAPSASLATTEAFLAEEGRRGWAIRQDERIVGAMGVNALLGGEVELGYWLEPAFQGRGLVTRGVAAIYAAGVAEGLFTSLFLLIAPGNGASEAVARRLGLAPAETVERGGRSLRAWRRR